MATKGYLFAVTHWLLTAATLLMLLTTALTALVEGALIAAHFNLDRNFLAIPAVVDGITRDTIFAVAIPAVAVLAIGALVFAVVFHLTAKIVESAILGDPFVSQNATRLTQIGWLLVGMEVLGWVMNMAAGELPPEVHGNLSASTFRRSGFWRFC